MRKVTLTALLGLLSIAAIAGVGASPALASPFTCTFGGATATITNTHINAQDNVQCSGGPAGYEVKVFVTDTTAPYSGAQLYWLDASGSTLDSLADLPQESCGTPNNQYSSGSNHLINADWQGSGGSNTCGSITANRFFFGNLPTKEYDWNTSSFVTLGNLCNGSHSYDVTFQADNFNQGGTSATGQTTSVVC